MSEPTPRTLLVIDDSPEDRALVRLLLRAVSSESTVVEAEDGAQGLALWRETRPDCVLLDFHLPDMEGLEVLEALRRSGGGTVPVPVVMLTGQADGAVANAALNGGAHDYVIKGTISAEALVRVVENAIERFTIERELDARSAALAEQAVLLQERTAALETRNRELEAVRAALQTNLLELADATRAKDQFVAVMSHEMRTPLNAILGYADLLDMEIGGELSAEQHQHVNRIRVGSRHLLDLINDVLDLARADARKLEMDLRPVDLGAVVVEVAALLESQARARGLSLEVEACGPGIPHVLADLQRLRQVLTNLVGNALKFTERGGVTVGCTLESGEVRVAVADTGIGIAPEVLPLVFSEFYQAQGALTRVRGGSGLGLAISQRLARLMGGEVTARSEPGRGSVFTLAIPTAEAGSELRDEDV